VVGKAKFGLPTTFGIYTEFEEEPRKLARAILFKKISLELFIKPPTILVFI